MWSFSKMLLLLLARKLGSFSISIIFIFPRSEPWIRELEDLRSE
jgi:hypothetical protein